MPTDCKGYILVDLINMIRNKLGDDGITKFKEINGISDYSGAKIYSEEEVIKFFKSFSTTMFGSDNKNNLIETGKMLARTHINSKVFSIVISLIGQKILGGFLFNQRTNKLLENSMKNISPSLELKVDNIDRNSLKITFYRTRIPVEIFYGEWMESLKYLKIDSLVSYQILTQDSFYLILSKK